MQFFLISYLLIVGYMWYTNPGKDEQARLAAERVGQTTGTLVAGTAASDFETTAALRTVDANSSVTVHNHPGEIANLRTDKYDINIDKIGGVINSWRLLDTGSQSFNREENTTGVELVRRIPGLIQEHAPHQNWPLEVYLKEQGIQSYEDFNHVTWTSENINVEGQPSVRLKSPPIRGLRIEKSLEMPSSDFYGNLRVTVYNDNASTVPVLDEFNRGLTVRWGPGLVARAPDDSDSSPKAYDAAVARDMEEVHVFRPSADDEPLEMQGPLQWAGVESKFFAALLVPQQPDDASRHQQYFFRTLVPKSYKVNPEMATTVKRQNELENYNPPLVMELSTQRFELAPNSSRTFDFGVYVGPKKHSILKQYGHDLQTLMYSESWWWMRALYLGMTDLLNWIHRVIISNYGIAIMLLTVIVKLLVFPLVHRSIKIQAKSSAEMKRVKPHIDAINEKYKDEPQEKQRQTWKVYQEHGINPLGAMRSCIPILPQMPVFIALYRITNDTIDLQGAHFLWIKDLSQADHLAYLGGHIPLIGSYFNILPILVAFTQMVSSKISMSRAIKNITDPNQIQMQKMMIYLVPLMVMVTMYHFPAGLMLYWMASNVWQIGQSLITNRILDIEEEKHLKAGPPPRKPKKPGNPNGIMAKLMEKANEARTEMERREQETKKPAAGNPRKKR